MRSLAKKPDKKESAYSKLRKTFSSSMDGVSSLLDDLSLSLYGTVTQDDSDKLNDRFNEIMSSEIDSITGNGVNDYSTFLGQVYSNDKDSASIMRELNAKMDLDTAGNGLNPAQFINEQYRNRMIQQADAYNISNQLIELQEAKSVMRDAIISTDVNTGRINRVITFEQSTVNDPSDSYLPIIEKMEKKFNLHARIKSIVDHCLGYGEYYVYHIPYHELFENFARKYRKINKGGRNFFESAVDSTVEKVEIFGLYDRSSKEDKAFFESVEGEIGSVIGMDRGNKDYGKIDDDVKSLLGTDRITISTSPIPIPILEESMESLSAFADEYITEDGDHFMEDGASKSSKKEGKKLQTTEDAYLRKYGNEMYDNDGVYGASNPNNGEKFADLKDCYVKEVPPTQMIPVEIMGNTLFYLYVQAEDAVPLNTILSYQSAFKQKDPSNKVDALVEDIATRIVGKFDQKFVAKNDKFRKLIVAALNYYELGNTRIHFQVVPKEYVTEFKINKDENDHGHSMLENSLFYAKLYLMLLLFKIVTIITKSNDQEINYLRTSGIDKNVYNKAQQIARQKQARRITVNDMFSYTGVLNKIGAGSSIYMPLGKNGDRPIETEILQGQSVEMNNDLMETLRNNYILSTGVPSAIMNYLNEADFAKSIETANTKMHGRTINYQLDFNDPITEMYQKLLRYTTSMPEEIIASVRVKFPEPKGTSNLTRQDAINNYQTLQEFLVKVYFGDSPDDDAHVKQFISEIARMHLPMINFEAIDEIYTNTKIPATEKALNSDDELDDVDNPNAAYQ